MIKYKIQSLSIIFPFYNEEKRIKRSLKKINKLFSIFKNCDLEIILVNDGSDDKSENYVKKNKNNKIKYIFYKKNKGKGFALKKGVEVASKDWVLTCDIDFAANPINIINWINKKYIKSYKDCYFGSRNLKNSVVKFKYIRKIIGFIFSIIRNLLFNIKVKDSQCGFKLYPKKIAKKIFSKLIAYGYIHDVEIFILLKKCKIKYHELPITWAHVNQGKVNIFFDSLIMLFQLIFLKLKY